MDEKKKGVLVIVVALGLILISLILLRNSGHGITGAVTADPLNLTVPENLEVPGETADAEASSEESNFFIIEPVEEVTETVEKDGFEKNNPENNNSQKEVREPIEETGVEEKAKAVNFTAGIIGNITNNMTSNNRTTQVSTGSLRTGDFYTTAICGGATACSCGDNVTSNYNLSSDLSSCEFSGLIVGNSSITIDCHGYQITGFASTLAAITSSNYNSVTIKNCNISGFARGIVFPQQTLTVSNINIINNTVAVTSSGATDYALDLETVDGGSVVNNTFSGTSQNAVYFKDLDEFVIENNNFSANKGDLSAVKIQALAVSTMDDSNFTNNNFAATYRVLTGEYFDRNYLLDNNFSIPVNASGYTHRNAGIYLSFFSDSNQIINNSIDIVTGFGIYLSDADNYNNFSGNNVTTSDGLGFGFYETGFSTIDTGNYKGNYLQFIDGSNTFDGLPIAYNLSVNNTVIYNNIDLSHTYSQLICANCTNITYQNIVMGKDGIFLASTVNSKINASNITSVTGSAIFLGNNSINNLISGNNITTEGVQINLVYLFDGADSNTLQNNLINTTKGSSSAVYVSGSFNRIVSNDIYVHASSSAGSGIYANAHDSGSGKPFGNELLNNNITSNGDAAIDSRQVTDEIPFYLTYNNEFGQINWTNNTRIAGTNGFLYNMTLMTTALVGINNTISLSNNTIGLNTFLFITAGKNPSINSTAEVTLYQLNYTNISQIYTLNNYTADNGSKIIELGTDCISAGQCAIISYSINNGKGTLVFNTTHFSVFAANGTPLSENNGPTLTQAYVNSSGAANTTGDDLQCWINASDDGSTILNAHWEWYRNDLLYSSGNTSFTRNVLTEVTTMPAANTTSNDRWNCSLRVTDDVAAPTAWINYTINVANLSCGDVVPSNENLTGDLTGCAGLGLNLTAANKVFDCHGYRITGARNSSIGLALNGSSYLNITNCNISGFSTGIGVYTAYNNHVSNNTFSNTSRAIYLVGTNWSDNPVLRSSNNEFFNDTILENVVGYELDSYTFQNNFTRETLLNNTHAVLINTSILPTSRIQSNYFWDGIFGNNTYDLNFVSGTASNNYFFNSSINKSKLQIYSGGEMKFGWYVDINVSNSSGEPIENAIIDYTLALAGTDIGTVNTSSNGLARINLVEFKKAGEVSYFYTPATITARKNLYTENSTSVNIHNLTYSSDNLTITKPGCGSTIYTSFHLGQNYVCAGDGFYVKGDNIIITGNGYNLTGSGSGTGIYVNNSKNVAIRDVQINNFDQGVYFYDVNNSNITGGFNISSNDLYGVVFNESYNNQLINTILSGNLYSNAHSISSSAGNNSLIQVTTNLDNLTLDGSASLLRKWNITVNATYVDNSRNVKQLQEAIINGYFNNTTRLDNSSVTSSTLAGKIGTASLYLTEYKQDSNGRTYLTPHNVSLSYTTTASGTLKNETSLNLTNTNGTMLNLRITLDCNTPNYLTDVNITSSLTLCPGTISTAGFWIQSNHVTVTCDGSQIIPTVYPGMDPDPIFYIATVNGSTIENVTVIRCSSGDSNYNYDSNIIHVSGAMTIRLLNLTLGSESSVPDTSIYIYNSNAVTIANSTIIQFNDILLENSNSSVVENNNLDSSYGITLRDSDHNIIRNNVFNSRHIDGIIFTNGTTATNNSIYHNNFTASRYTINYFNSTGTSQINTFNISNSPAQGNKYSEYCGKGSDTDGDNYANAVSSASAADWPYSENVSGVRINDPSNDNKGVIDYGPYVFSCPATEVFAQSSTSTGGATTESSGSSTPAASVTDAAESVAAESGASAEEVAKFLESKQGSINELEDGLEVDYSFTNTGDKVIEFDTSLYDDSGHFWLVKDKTVGLPSWLGLQYSQDAPFGNLLKSELEGSKSFKLNPGETKETKLKIKTGLSAKPREIKVEFKSFGETVKSDKISSMKVSNTGAVLDLVSEENKFDLYLVLAQERPSQAKQEVQDQGANSLFTAAAVFAKENDFDQYYLEMSLRQKSGLLGNLKAKLGLGSFWSGEKTVFADYYGPFDVPKGEGFVLAQQFLYDDKKFSGPYIINTKLYKNGVVVSENKHDAVFS